MPAKNPPVLAPLLKKLRTWWPLSDEDSEAVLALPHKLREYRPHEYIVREGDRTHQCCVMLSGYSYRHKMTGTGARQIFSIHMKGDAVDLENSLLREADHNVQTLTKVEAAMIPIADIEALAHERPHVGSAFWRATLIDGAIYREWTLNVGRRDARTRMAHMLCEFALRLEDVGLGESTDYELPMTQEQLADALGLTPVHVNRTLRALQAEGLIERTQRAVKIGGWDKLAEVGDFDPAYLHLKPDAMGMRV